MSFKKFKTIPILTMFLWMLPLSIALAHGISEADKQAMIEGGNLQYIWLGATHMLTGYDHLLFIFGVIFFLTGFRDIVKFITAFTAGHSITLLLATAWGISANYFLVDAVIALSVMYKGFENLDGFKKYLGVSSPNLLWVVFGFGLIHGFGLSTRLQQLPLGEDGFIMRLLSFNLGVELGQIIALSIMLVLIVTWRKTESFAKFSTAANAMVVIAGALLFLMQMHGYLHTAYPDEFGFSRDNHHHEHLRMKNKGHSHGNNEKAHSHGNNEKAHSHGNNEKAHSHGNNEKAHSHGNENKGHSHSHKKKKKVQSYGDKSLWKTHKEKATGKPHSHGTGKPHTH